MTNNQGVATSPDGRKVLKTLVALNTPCPFCGKRHTYRAENLACPFGSEKQ